MGGRGSGSGSYRQKANSLVQRVSEERERIPAVRAGGQLTGTDKQVSWARDIRADAAKRINDMIRRDADQGLTMTERRRDTALSRSTRQGSEKSPERVKRDRDSFERYATIQVDGMKKRAKQASDVQSAIDSHKSASWWIDNRLRIVQALGYSGSV